MPEIVEAPDIITYAALPQGEDPNGSLAAHAA